MSTVFHVLPSPREQSTKRLADVRPKQNPKFSLSYPQQVNHRLAIQNHSHSGSPRASQTPVIDPQHSESTETDDGFSTDKRSQATVDKEIEELEAELEIARLEAKLAKLRNVKKGSNSGSSSGNNSGSNSVDRNSHDASDVAVRLGSFEGDQSSRFNDVIVNVDEEREREVRSKGSTTPLDKATDGIDL